MGVIERVEADFKAALKARRQDEVSALRLVRAALKNKEKEGRGPVGEEEAVKVLKTLAKQRQESIDQFSQAGRTDLAAKEEAELKIISAYLPAQVDEATIRQAVAEAIAELGARSMKDLGGVMKNSLARLGAGADGKKVNAIVKELLQAG